MRSLVTPKQSQTCRPTQPPAGKDSFQDPFFHSSERFYDYSSSSSSNLLFALRVKHKKINKTLDLTNVKGHSMGNSAAKEVQNAELGNGSLLQNESSSISSSLISGEEGTNAKCKGKTWYSFKLEGTAIMEEAVLFSMKHKGMIKSHTIVNDISDNMIAVVITEKMGMASVTNFICKPMPTFDGQAPLTSDELKKAGIDESTVLFKFSKIDTKRGLSSGTSTYSIVSGKEDGAESSLTLKELYTAEKLSAMGFQALFKEGDVIVAKAATKGMAMTPNVEASSGVDLLAVVLIGYTLAGDNSAAGGMAGAGVV